MIKDNPFGLDVKLSALSKISAIATLEDLVSVIGSTESTSNNDTPATVESGEEKAEKITPAIVNITSTTSKTTVSNFETKNKTVANLVTANDNSTTLATLANLKSRATTEQSVNTANDVSVDKNDIEEKIFNQPEITADEYETDEFGEAIPEQQFETKNLTVSFVSNARKIDINEVVSEAETTTVAAFNLYSNLDSGVSTLPDDVKNSQVAGYEKASTTTPVASSIEGGINISVNTDKQADATVTLGNIDELRHVKLDSSVKDDVIISEPEGKNIWSSVIDVSGSTRNTLIAVGNGNETSYVNHTIKGSSYDGNTAIVIGKNSRGNNYVQGGDHGVHIYNAGAKATLSGGADNDSIYAGKGDYVEGGAGKDYFYDSNGANNSGKYTIGDFSVEDGDVIVATKLSSKATLTSDDFVFGSDAVAIAGGNQIILKNSGNKAIFTDASGNKDYKLMWADKYGGVVNADNVFESDTGVMIFTNYNHRGDTVTGSVKGDTIFAGGNDIVEAGDGKDQIYLTKATGNEYGAAIYLSDKTEKAKEVNDWSFGFNKSDNVIIANDTELSFLVTKNDNLYVSSDKGALVLVAKDNSTRNRFDVLIGKSKYNAKKVSVLRNKVESVVDNNKDIADVYYAAGNRAVLTFTENVTEDIKLTLSEDDNEVRKFNLGSNGKATIVGSNESEFVTLGGAAARFARKTVSLGGGNDKIVSGGTDTSTSGHTILFGASDGEDTISNFGYYQGKSADFLKKSADIIVLDGVSSIGSDAVNVSQNKVSITLSSSGVLNITDEVNTDNMVMFKIGDETQVAKFGLSNNRKGNRFTYNKEVTAYYGDSKNKKDTLTADDSSAHVEVYLDGSQGVKYYGINEVDASSNSKGRVILYGNSEDNKLISGGKNATLWGGAGNDTLIGSDANDTFIFGAGDGNDSISSFDRKVDKVKLNGVTLADISDAKFSSDNSISIELTDGSKLTVGGEGSLDGACFQISTGNNSYRNYTAKKSDDGTITWK